MKKTVTLFLVLALVVAMAAPVMALNIPDTDDDTGTIGGYRYTCDAYAELFSAGGSMTYANSKTTISVGMTLRRAANGTGVVSTYSNIDRGNSDASLTYNNNAYRITKASFAFLVGSDEVFASVFNEKET